MAGEVETVISNLMEQIAELQLEVGKLKVGIADERWQHTAANFKQLSDNLIHVDERLTAIDGRLDELTREPLQSGGGV